MWKTFVSGWVTWEIDVCFQRDVKQCSDVTIHDCAHCCGLMRLNTLIGKQMDFTIKCLHDLEGSSCIQMWFLAPCSNGQHVQSDIFEIYFLENTVSEQGGTHQFSRRKVHRYCQIIIHFSSAIDIKIRLCWVRTDSLCPLSITNKLSLKFVHYECHKELWKLSQKQNLFFIKIAGLFLPQKW